MDLFPGVRELLAGLHGTGYSLAVATGKSRKGLDRALDSYNRGVGSLEGRVLRTARKFKERGAIAGEDIEILEPIDKAARVLNFDEGGLFPDLVAGETEDDDSLPLLNSLTAHGGEP